MTMWQPLIKRVESEPFMFVNYWWRRPGIEDPKFSACKWWAIVEDTKVLCSGSEIGALDSCAEFLKRNFLVFLLGYCFV